MEVINELEKMGITRERIMPLMMEMKMTHEKIFSYVQNCILTKKPFDEKQIGMSSSLDRITTLYKQIRDGATDKTKLDTNFKSILPILMPLVKDEMASRIGI